MYKVEFIISLVLLEIYSRCYSTEKKNNILNEWTKKAIWVRKQEFFSREKNSKKHKFKHWEKLFNHWNNFRILRSKKKLNVYKIYK